MAAPEPGQFDAQAPGATQASGTASQSLENDQQSLERQLAELQVGLRQSQAAACLLACLLAVPFSSLQEIDTGFTHPLLTLRCFSIIAARGRSQRMAGRG